MLNTLANHNFLPHDGRMLTEDVVISVFFSKALNLDREFGAFLFGLGLPVNPEPNATFFNLYVKASLRFSPSAALPVCNLSRGYPIFFTY